MTFSVQFGPLAEVAADWLIVMIPEEEAPFGAVADLDMRLDGALTRLKQNGDLTGKALEVRTLLDRPGIAARRLLLVGLGKRDQADRAAVTSAAAAAALAITDRQHERIALALPENIPNLDWATVALAVGAGLIQGSQGPGIRQTKTKRFAPRELILAAPQSAPGQILQQAAWRATVEGRAVALARELVNTPPNELYPETFAARANEIAKAGGIECTIWDEAKLESERMGSLLGVARGSDRPARFVILKYHGGGERTLGLVGKGVTFDSGGLSLKPSDSMIDMKCDMAGAATVLAAVRALADMQAPVQVLALLPLVENMPSGKALKLGDVLHARNGKTIEIHNTDAEGRLILADALAFAVEQKVDHLVDLATLTGACLVALGTEVAGLMTNNDTWAGQVRAAAERCGEMVWQLPMFPHYNELIKSKVADIKNTGGTRWGGAITAAKFLEEFVGTVPWVHLDIAGPAWAEQEGPTREAGGTGTYVRTLVELGLAYGKSTIIS